MHIPWSLFCILPPLSFNYCTALFILKTYIYYFVFHSLYFSWKLYSIFIILDLSKRVFLFFFSYCGYHRAPRYQGKFLSENLAINPILIPWMNPTSFFEKRILCVCQIFIFSIQTHLIVLTTVWEFCGVSQHREIIWHGASAGALLWKFWTEVKILVTRRLTTVLRSQGSVRAVCPTPPLQRYLSQCTILREKRGQNNSE